MHHKSDVNEAMTKVPLFMECTPEELAQIARAFTSVEVSAGRVLARQGTRGYELLVITEGSATVDIDGEVVATLGPGDFIGEIALLDGGPRTATVTAASDSVIEAMHAREFTELLLHAPHLMLNILKGVAKRLRATDLRLMQRGSS
jgi:CRP/FNR family transcriptional regulator, cyclic AMP receptor protein